MGTFKIKGERIITIKDGIKETWSVGNGETSKFIKFNGVIYNIIKTETI